jgi:RHS repeat-associated protein
MNRTTTRRDPLLRTETYTYDNNGNLATVLDRKSQTTTNTYDPLNRRTKATFQDSTSTNYTYDAGNRITQVQEKNAGGTVTATITRGYDGLDRLTQEVTAEGTVNYTYDNASRRATMTVVGQPQVVYTYDNANRLTQIQQGTSTVTIGYDDADRRTSVTYPNTNSVTYGYNVASELTSITYKQGATTLGTLTYTYDAAGNRIKTGGTFARSNLPPALTTTNYNANNQQLMFGTTTETYDLNGNLATFTDASGTTTYTWNARNQLTGITKTGFTASFTYDSFGRRTGKTVQGTTTNFLYDGLSPVQEKNGATVNANLLTGLGIDEFFTRTDSVGVRSLLPDALGSTVALGDGTGTLQTQYTYEPFGFVSQTGAASTSSYKYTGREDDGTGLYYYRARYYQPRLQRFIAEDPIGFRGGVNFYSYVSGNPVGLVDPLGLASLTTDMKNGKTTFDPRPEDPNANPTTIDTLNKVTSGSQLGANDPLSTPDVSCLLIGPSRKYGPTGAYLDTGDSRGRDIHGGGSSLADPLAPIQPLTPTQGCTRGHNQDLQDLCNKITDFKRRHPGVPIPYIRR